MRKIPVPALAPYEQPVFYIFWREGAYGLFQPYNRNQVYSSIQGAKGALKALREYFQDAGYQFQIYPAVVEVPLSVAPAELLNRQIELGVRTRTDKEGAAI